MTNKVIIFSLGTVVLASVIGIGIWQFTAHNSYAAINSYDECAAAGYPVMETYPEQCRLPNGRTFVREIKPGDPDVNVAPPVESVSSSTSPGTPTSTAFSEFNKPVILRIGTTAKFSDGLSIKLNALNDSRCKPNVQCIWQGEIGVVLGIRWTGSALQEIRLGTVTQKTAAFSRYAVTLQDATAQSATIIVTKGNPAPVPTGTLTGYVHIGPTCPVEHDPPQPGCADRPYANSPINVTNKTTGNVSTVATDASGNFRISLIPGTYTVTPKLGAAAYPTCDTKDAIIGAGKTTSVDLSCDSGIR